MSRIDVNAGGFGDDRRFGARLQLRSSVRVVQRNRGRQRGRAEQRGRPLSDQLLRLRDFSIGGSRKIRNRIVDGLNLGVDIRAQAQVLDLVGVLPGVYQRGLDDVLRGESRRRSQSLRDDGGLDLRPRPRYGATAIDEGREVGQRREVRLRGHVESRDLKS